VAVMKENKPLLYKIKAEKEERKDSLNNLQITPKD
jgi:hypothetical protein